MGKREFQTPGGKQSEVRSPLERLIGNLLRSEDPQMQELFRIGEKVAPTDATILITGDSGTGKELLAHFIHAHSDRADMPMVPVNCGAIPENLMESELFGHVKGAFTGAHRDRIGRFQLADRGTIFLDEIGELPTHMQVKLLRVLQSRRFEPVGAAQSIEVDFRVIAATNANLEEKVAHSEFREDLYYRLNVIPLHIPSLCGRPADILRLVRHFVDTFNETKGCAIEGFSDGAAGCLAAYPWPGNIRQLENIIERMVIIQGEGVVRREHLPEMIKAVEPIASSVSDEHQFLPDEIGDEGVDLNGLIDQLEIRMIKLALTKAGGNKNKAAGLLGLKRTTLVEKIKKKGIEI